MNLHEYNLKPDERAFDWVKARYDCCTAVLFSDLVRTVRQATENRNGLNSQDGSVTKFEFSEEGNGGNTYAEVLRKNDGRKVEFRLDGRYIRINGYGAESITLRAGISLDGTCILLNGNTAFPYWFIVSQALDSLFFDEHTDCPR